MHNKYAWFFGHFKSQANAFEACCAPFHSDNRTLFDEWVDDYHSTDRQLQIIFNCIQTVPKSEEKCWLAFNTTLNIHQNLCKYIDFVVGYNNTEREKQLKSLKSAIREKPDPEQVFWKFHDKTRDHCRHVFSLLWVPYRLEACIDALDDTGLGQFKNEIAPLIFDIVIRFHDDLLTVLEPIHTLSEERHLSFTFGNYVPDETFSEDTKFVTDRLMIYKDLFRHPMILPYKEISLAYDYCCGDVQSSETFQDYTMDLSNYATSYRNIMERLERCYQRSRSTLFIHLRPIPESCDHSKRALAQIFSDRDHFVSAYKQNYPQFIAYCHKSISKSIEPDQRFRKIEYLILSYCEKHLTVLLLDPQALIKCDELLRQNFQTNHKKYSFYTQDFSQPVITLIERYWHAMNASCYPPALIVRTVVSTEKTTSISSVTTPSSAPIVNAQMVQNTAKSVDFHSMIAIDLLSIVHISLFFHIY